MTHPAPALLRAPRLSHPPLPGLLLALSPLLAGHALAQPTAPTVDALPTIEVSDGAAGSGYHADEASGSKTALPLRELPQSVRVITAQAIEDRGATRLDEVLDQVSGISRQNNYGGLWDNVAIRGLPGHENTGAPTLLNGLSAGRGFNAPRDLAGVERIEFLKGPAAALYGSSEPGGTLNIVSKRPLWQAAHGVSVQAGTQGYKRAAFDSSAPLGDRFSYRLNVAVEDRDSFRDFVHSQRQVIAPAFTWKLGRDTVLEYAGEYLRHQAPLDRGVVAVNHQLGAISRSRFLGEPADGELTVKNQTHQFLLSHAVNPQWTSRVALSWRRTGLRGSSSEASALRADGTLTRQHRFRDYQSEDLAAQAELQGTVRTGAVAHELLFGVESYRFELDSFQLRVNPSTARPYALNIYQPIYGQVPPTPLPNTDTLETQRNNAFYVQDTVHLAPDWRLMAGVRVDHYRQSLANRRTGAIERQTPGATSPRLGLSWLPTPQWTLYANAGRSFRPNIGTDSAARGFDPERGRALEAGAKWESADRRSGATVAVFDIRKRNVLTGDPVNLGYSVAAGEMRSRGLEADFSGQLSAHWRLSASASYTDASVTRDQTLEVGSRVLNVPRVQASAMAFYEDAFADGQRWGLGGGITHVGRRAGQARTQAEASAGTPAFELPAYTTARLSAYWQWHRGLRLTLDIDNLFDRTYYPSSYSRLWVAPGDARSVRVGMQAKF
ncbi:MAG: TonB-dependent siderophore receptor [Comamonadaceae bacterium]|nr:MAG: TonB-dependent siderophore receptor [Comamonadaceae bacterium]